MRTAYGALTAVALAYAIAAALGAGDTPLANVAYYCVLGGVVALTLLRAAATRHERAAWIALAGALLCWSLGDLVSSIAYADAVSVPIPSVADALYLAFYPLAFAAVVLLARSRLRVTNATVWLDGLTVALAAAALSALLLFGPIVKATGGPAWEVATNTAYPVGDLLLALAITGFVVLRGVRMGRGLLLLVGAMLLFAVTDAAYLYQSAVGSYAEDSVVNAGWPLAFLLFGAAAWQPAGVRVTVGEERYSVVLPVGFGVVSVGLLVVDHFSRVHPLVLWASAASLLAILARVAVTFALAQRLLTDRARQALTDPVTGLRNRRSLMADLQAQLAAPRAGRRVLLALFDLDGFKEYNDSFGHPAGDLLLIRLAQALGAVADGAPGAAAYRMGGDEFCLLATVEADVQPEPLVARATAALAERGDAFTIGASAGHALLEPGDGDVERALRLADQRMYAAKHSRRASALRQTQAVLTAVLDARDPALADHLGGVARSAERVARQLGLSEQEIGQVRDAAELHDIGKVAIPDAILHKPQRLDPEEWRFMRRHTVLGERIVAAAPSLRGIAPIVRSHHERWDGRGYPDGLRGDAIPIGAQIVFVCDAYDAMTSDRTYRAALSEEAALEQLREGAGSQFSPRVVEAFRAARRAPLRVVPRSPPAAASSPPRSAAPNPRGRDQTA